jgi:hypothetical protein
MMTMHSFSIRNVFDLHEPGYAEGKRAMPREATYLTLFEPATYSIRVQGALDANWSGRLGGLRILVVRAGDQAVTELSGQLADQAALVGVLTSLYDLGMPLLSVERIAAP